MESALPIRIAIIDLYDRTPNEGMRAIRELLEACDRRFGDVPLVFDIFETRFDGSVPDDSYDVFISTGGPGSPFDGQGTAWEAAYFRWLDGVVTSNAKGGDQKFAFFICHSFQMMVRHFEVATVNRRKSESFGVFPVHPTTKGQADPLLRTLDDPFYAADFRNWQVVGPNRKVLNNLGASVLAHEKMRLHIPLERAIMGIRISPELVGVQFHPEADPEGMSRHFRQEARRTAILKKISEEKYQRILHRLEDPAFLKRTHDAVLPGFLERTVQRLRPECFPVEAEV